RNESDVVHGPPDLEEVLQRWVTIEQVLQHLDHFPFCILIPAPTGKESDGRRGPHQSRVLRQMVRELRRPREPLLKSVNSSTRSRVSIRNISIGGKVKDLSTLIAREHAVFSAKLVLGEEPREVSFPPTAQ